jgi:cytoskeletal protein CcmA (bactofilin family)
MNETTAHNVRQMMEQRANSSAVTEETSIITAGTMLTGDITSDGSFDIQGTINGNVTCNGKLVVTGAINGNSAASEIFADVAKIEGEVVSSGTVKIGAGSVIIGNISAASAVIAGAIKGDIDVQGPVVVDTSAVVMGNIKSRSVQINNGAVIEGFCSQCYADIDVESLFEGR